MKGNQSRIVTDQYEKLICSLLLRKTGDFVQLCCLETGLKEALEAEVLKIIQKEIKGVCQKDQMPILSLKTEENLIILSWDKLAKEMQLKTPTFWISLQQADSTPCQELKKEPRHDKTNKVTMRPAKTQISLGIHPV